MFLAVPLSKSKIFTCVALVSFVSLVSHSCCIRVAHVALVSLVSGTRVVN